MYFLYKLLKQKAMSKETIWKDTVHGFIAVCKSKTVAWGLIRNKCHELKLEVPTLDKIIQQKPNENEK